MIVSLLHMCVLKNLFVFGGQQDSSDHIGCKRGGVRVAGWVIIGGDIKVML